MRAYAHIHTYIRAYIHTYTYTGFCIHTYTGLSFRYTPLVAKKKLLISALAEEEEAQVSRYSGSFLITIKARYQL